jgi:flagellar hook-basal body complex protein FliE
MSLVTSIPTGAQSFLQSLERMRGPQDPAEISLPGADAGARTSGATAPGSGTFSSLLNRAVAEVDSKLQAAQTEQSRVLTGETNNLHQSMIAIQEASVAFSLMVEVRNKLVESYQELMRMQV